MPGRRRLVRDGVGINQPIYSQKPTPKPGPVPVDQPIVSAEVEAKLRALGLRITGILPRWDGTLQAIELTDTLGKQYGLSDIQTFADARAKENPTASLLGGVFAEMVLALREPDRTKRAVRQAGHVGGMVLKNLEQQKGGPAQQDQGSGDTPAEPLKPGTSPCWFGGHDQCPKCFGCRRAACTAIHCDCPEKRPHPEKRP